MEVCVVHCPRLIIRIVLAPALPWPAWSGGLRKHRNRPRTSHRQTENDPSALADLQATIVEGAANRLRPKFMTVATMFVGLIPIM